MVIISAIVFIVGIAVTFLGVIFSNRAKKSNLESRDFYQNLSKLSAFITAVCFALAILLPIGLPQYAVWQQSKEGESELAKAEQN